MARHVRRAHPLMLIRELQQWAHAAGAGRAGSLPVSDDSGRAEPAPPDMEYVVQAGDTFSLIARAHGIATARLLALNGLSWSSGIAPGQRLRVEWGEGQISAGRDTDLRRHSISHGETVSGIAARYGLSRAEVLRANGLHPTSAIFIGQTLVIPSADGLAPGAFATTTRAAG